MRTVRCHFINAEVDKGISAAQGTQQVLRDGTEPEPAMAVLSCDRVGFNEFTVLSCLPIEMMGKLTLQASENKIKYKEN